MNNNIFDEHLKSVLENIEAPYDPETWSKLTARMDGLASANGAWMDESLAGKLEQLEAPYQPAHWDKMAAKLDQEDNRRRRIWMYKIAEAAVFLLLIANVLYMTQGFDPNGGPVVQNNTEEIQRTTNKTRKSFKPDSEKGIAPTVAETGLTAAVSGLAAFATALTTAVEAATASSGTGITATTLPAATTTSPNTLTGAVKTLLNNDAAMAAILQQTTETLPGTELYPLVSGLQQPASLPMIKKTSKTGRFFAGFSTGIQFDRIHNGTENTLSSQQMAFDADIVYRKGKWGVSSGVRYTRKRFQPKPQVEIYAGDPSKGYYGSYIDAVDASIVSLPVQASRRVARIGKSTVHALAGFTANVAVEKSYRNKTVYYPGQTPDPNPVAAAPAFNRDANGWLEHGALSDNHYISADAGLRIEAPMTKRTMIFVESVYQHALGGNGFVNPPARINTVGVYAGVVAGL